MQRLQSSALVLGQWGACNAVGLLWLLPVGAAGVVLRVGWGCAAGWCSCHVDVAVLPQPGCIHGTMQRRRQLAVSVVRAVQAGACAADVAAETVAVCESATGKGRLRPCAGMCKYVKFCGGLWRQSLCTGPLLFPPFPSQEHALCWPSSGGMLL